MKTYQTCLSILSAGTLLGCTSLSLAPATKQPLATAVAKSSSLPRIQAVVRNSSPASELETAALKAQLADAALKLARVEAELAADAPPRVTGPQLVEVSPNVYELRDASGAVTATVTATAKITTPGALPVVGQAAAVVGVFQGIRIEISNGVGIRRLARRTADHLAGNGVTTTRLTNQPNYLQSKTEIQYGVGQEQTAMRLSALMPVPVTTVPSNNLNPRIQMRLVLGHDLGGKAVAAWVDSAAGKPAQTLEVSPVTVSSDALKFRSYRSPASVLPVS
jgi:hypothetical protein